MSANLTPDWSSEFEHYKQLSRKVVTKEDIINFFDQNQKAFYLDNFSSSWGKMMEAYETKESLSAEQLNKLEEMQWIAMPESLKLFAYDFCIKNGFCFTGTSR
ncbi:hypothetical protein [Prochlorococcus marinus]|uniref:Uncharacterized protein n=1 Tax=Prochlorococcus marinus XMU1408 TaxID=2213228 RepID=A0A318R3S2_PROMR|nr:hypothetical protein [Prochlorococcus marinus]MBW3041090.1 hypothetical protein [Prochlorococcus marinus str. XMU1408]PYE03694.1 hypothetical protein DNJ73_00455 [Prochlorococcus marinus XMU1408]